ncbi:MAG: ATP-binding cassette domain-containing protein [Candidatus Omnitrophota bacterium]|jgi:phospholipid/cholesterol/gamma-HCH transport system ATP-binding protein
MDLKAPLPHSHKVAVGEPVIELKRVTLRYASDDVVKEADLMIRSGETKVILGPSGVGKSTILKGILGLLKPKTGEIFVAGQPLSQLSEKELRKIRLLMSMVFQNGALFDSMTVGENVSFRLRELNLAKPEDIQNRVAEVLRFVGLAGATKLRPAQLSGGMRKRVAIARGLAPDPQIFLFDEPTVGLDPVNYYNIEQLILKLKARPATTIVVVTHDVQSAMRLADSIVMLYDGKFIFEGPPEKLKLCADPRVRAFLDPASAQL